MTAGCTCGQRLLTGFGRIRETKAGCDCKPEPWYPSHAERLAWCEANDHPPATYNPNQRRTWCECGAVVRDGNAGKCWRLSLGECDCGCGPISVGQFAIGGVA